MRLTLIITTLLLVTLAHADPDFDRLVALIKTDDVAGVTHFLDAHPKYKKINYGTTALFRPIFLARSPQMVQVLLDNGAERPRPIVRDFFEAIRADNVVLVGEILDQDGKTTVDEDGDEVVVDVPVNCLGEQRRRAIFYATSPEMVMLLLSRGALLTKTTGTKTVTDYIPYTDRLGNNALHVLAENTRNLIDAYPRDHIDILRRVEATARLIIRIDAGLNGPGNLILAHQNGAHQRAMDVFTGNFWDPEFIQRLALFDRNMRIAQAFFDDVPVRVAAPPRVAVPPLALARPVVRFVRPEEVDQETLQVRQEVIDPPAIRAPDPIERTQTPDLIERNATPGLDDRDDGDEDEEAELASLLSRMFPNH